MTLPDAQLYPETAERPSGIYVHIPFCLSKCPYCSFNSYEQVSTEVKQSYMQALLVQARNMAAHPWSKKRKFSSLYIGGGTPSTVKISSLAGFIDFCLGSFSFTPASGSNPEVTVEVNPKTVSRQKLESLRGAGANRLSIGVQSFSDEMLAAMGRKYSAADCLQALADARTAGFENISLDLMYGLPGQGIGDWHKNLETALALAPEHFSVYELTIEKDTPFAALAEQGQLALPDERTTINMFESAREILTTEGYVQYEISNYARKGFSSIHNKNYWENGSYLGLGSGAVSCFSGLRIHNVKSPEYFIKMIGSQQPPFSEGEFLSEKARFNESVIMGLRMTEGVSISLLEKEFGIKPDQHYGETLNLLIKEELLEYNEDRLRLTHKGVLLANRVMAELV
jgi:oxygen-independent coproporphyrinogen-3 oxidase